MRREEGKYICVCCRHTWLERYIDRCVPERRSRGPTHTAGGRPKEKYRTCAMEGTLRVGERGAGVCMHDRKLALASYK